MAGIAIAFAEGTGQSYAAVLFSGQNELPPFAAHAATWSIGALVAVVVCKGLAYGISLSSFRGGPIFPSLFIGAAGGVALSHLPGLPMVAGMAMGIGAMSTAMLKLPLTSVLVASLLVASAGSSTIPLIIVASTVAYVASAHFAPGARQRRPGDRVEGGGGGSRCSTGGVTSVFWFRPRLRARTSPGGPRCGDRRPEGGSLFGEAAA